MQSKALHTDDYLKEVPAERLAILVKMRALCLKELKSYEEAIVYGMPCYLKNKIVEVSFASQKNFIALYILKQDVMDKYKEHLQGKGISTGKGCIRYAKPENIDLKLVEKMLKDTYTSTNSICG